MNTMQLISALSDESVSFDSELTCMFLFPDNHGERRSVNGVLFSKKDEEDLKVLLTFHDDNITPPKNPDEKMQKIYEISLKPPIKIIDIILKLAGMIKINTAFANANVCIFGNNIIPISGIETGVRICDEGRIPYTDVVTISDKTPEPEEEENE